MSGYQPGVQVGRTARHGRLQLALDIERVLDVSTRQPIRAEFTFAPEAPSIVCAEFGIEGGPRVLWRIERDVLCQGLHARSGTGDVQVWPSPVANRATAWLQLASGDMAALFALPVAPLAEWLEHTYELVPAGRAHPVRGMRPGGL
ncbi:SsgA family sporulation/cell division regulator [Streptomyces sp. NPDC059063]|uniref:SsgA family sporulation/cell division regulator n=1 Tax=unclassified Streptomyces TaxID=2593676 RepID=UPI0036B46960